MQARFHKNRRISLHLEIINSRLSNDDLAGSKNQRYRQSTQDIMHDLSCWREVIVIPILKPGKVATDPLSYRPIALTSSFYKTFERMRIVSLLRVYQALILSHLDYGCVVYGSARASVLKRLDTIHHSALRICSGAFRTSPVTSLYVVCHQPPLELRRKQLSANYFIRVMSVPSHPLKPFDLPIGLNQLYEARSFNIKPFSEREKAVLNDAHLNNINIKVNNILAFPP
ncbi:RNase H domain-containing protein [Trichonephila clavipes]|nr:RNase H domain-containing protein [Trichonephila clavipes]